VFVQLLESESFVTSLASKSPDVVAFLKANGRTEKLIDLVVSVDSLSPVVLVGTEDVPAEVQLQRRYA
jgi:hypothetical protein